MTRKPTENERFLIGAIRRGVIEAIGTLRCDPWEVVMDHIDDSAYVSPADTDDLSASQADEFVEFESELVQKIWSQFTTAAHDAIRDVEINLK